ncbi:MAG TPA: Ref family recombination enhancement nuclease [Gallionella sp.]|nr:Ref family recombination enhancement nuclease [Gallionella sp.]
MNKAEKSHLDKVASLGCIVCRIIHHVFTPACIHHLTGIKYRSTGKKASNFHVIGLCHNHHQGHQGVHTMGMRPWEAAFGTQEYLLDYTNQIIAETH